MTSGQKTWRWSGPFKLTEEDKLAAADLYEAGLDTKSVAECLGVRENEVFNAVFGNRRTTCADPKS